MAARDGTQVYFDRQTKIISRPPARLGLSCDLPRCIGRGGGEGILVELAMSSQDTFQEPGLMFPGDTCSCVL